MHEELVPPVMAVMGLQFGYLIGGSILVRRYSPGPAVAFC